MVVAPFSSVACIVRDVVAAYERGEIADIVVVYRRAADDVDFVCAPANDDIRSIGLLEMGKHMLAQDRMGTP